MRFETIRYDVLYKKYQLIGLARRSERWKNARGHYLNRRRLAYSQSMHANVPPEDPVRAAGVNPGEPSRAFLENSVIQYWSMSVLL